MTDGSLLVVTGPPGAGKSTVARLLADSMPHSVLVEGDAFFGFLANGAIPPWRPESHEQNTVVTRVAGLATGEFVRGGFNVVFDGIVGPWFLDTFADFTGLGELDYVVLLPPSSVCRQRVRDRSGHGFTDLGATEYMHRQFDTAEVSSRHVLTDRDGSPESSAAKVVQMRSARTLRYVVS